jgi:hypothetical protein
MMRSTTSWLPKLRPDARPKIVPDRRGRMLVPTPMLVAREMRKVPKGRLITPIQLRDRLARAARADLTCPMTTGIFLNIVAGAAEESLRAGRRPVAPYWRVVRPDGPLPEKFPIPAGAHAAHLRSEGHRLATGRVASFGRALVAR